jgi:hypothetical protein
VVDYHHVKNGPVTLLVAHEYDISIDDADGRRGLFFSRKQPTEGNFGARLSAAIQQTCEICQRIEADGHLGNQVTFGGNEIRLVLNDRLLAPNTDDTLQAIQADLDAVLGALYGDAKVSVSRRNEVKARFILDVKADGKWSVDQLLKNLS